MNAMLRKTARFEMTAFILGAALILVTVSLLVPYSVRVITQGRSLYGFWNAEERIAEHTRTRTVLQRENRLLDSLIALHEKNVYTDESSVAATLYERADSAGIKTSKIEIGERKSIEERFQTPVTVQGTGNWAALGAFCEAVENLPAPARIRLISAEGEGKGSIKLFLDFVLLSQGN